MVNTNKILILFSFFFAFFSIYAVSTNEETLSVQPSSINFPPSEFVNLEGHAEASHAIIVEKNLHKLNLFHVDKFGNYSLEKQYFAITGKEQGDKKFRGDNRTPEGIYFVVGKKSKKDLLAQFGNYAKKYGDEAFVLDYPNIFDKRSRKTGSGIWIHGVEHNDRVLTPFDTEGCVALQNRDVKDLEQYISNFETPVVIVDKIETRKKEDILLQKKTVLELLEGWRSSWENSDFENYMSYYSGTFQTLGMGAQDWLKYKKRISKKRNQLIQIKISSPNILSFKNQILVTFVQKYSSNEKVDLGRKFLYLKKEEEDDSYHIIAEKWYPINESENTTQLDLAFVN